MKTTMNAFIMRLLGVIMLSFIVGSFVKTIESKKDLVLKDFITMTEDIVSNTIVPSTINAKVVFIERIPTYTVKPHIGLQMNMSNNVFYGYSCPTNCGEQVFNINTGRYDSPPELDPESG